MRLVLPSSYRSRSALGRVTAAVVALIGLAALAIFGILALAILAVGGCVWFIWFRWRLHRLRKRVGRTAGNHAGVIEGEYVVIHESEDGTR